MFGPFGTERGQRQIVRGLLEMWGRGGEDVNYARTELEYEQHKPENFQDKRRIAYLKEALQRHGQTKEKAGN